MNLKTCSVDRRQQENVQQTDSFTTRWLLLEESSSGVFPTSSLLSVLLMICSSGSFRRSWFLVHSWSQAKSLRPSTTVFPNQRQYSGTSRPLGGAVLQTIVGHSSAAMSQTLVSFWPWRLILSTLAGAQLSFRGVYLLKLLAAETYKQQVSLGLTNYCILQPVKLLLCLTVSYNDLFHIFYVSN